VERITLTPARAATMSVAMISRYSGRAWPREDVDAIAGSLHEWELETKTAVKVGIIN
jgi:hypothetical protein